MTKDIGKKNIGKKEIGKKDIDKIVTEKTGQIEKLHEIVRKSIEDKTLITNNLLNPPKEILTTGQSISDKVSKFGGSWIFIILFFVLLIIWILFNTLTPLKDNFDPYPFILMNLILSCVAALQAPIIMMSQNRQEEKDRKRNENDYLINMKAELEIKALNKKIDLLIEEQIQTLFKSQERQLEILIKIDRKQ